ncbi:MAG: phosphocholine cytidylyltransferase family protein [Candidatus Omnitrophica bacterium]|nr:phosphocholine cytidylyltransferase family protein [Candidatus Omnitrophota bacterium]
MKTIILAGGRGSRMKGLTDEKPKCLNVLAGRTLFDWQLDALFEAGMNDIVVARGYKKELLNDPSKFKTVDNLRWDQTNMVGTLLCAREYLKNNECIVAYADIVYHPDIIKKLKEAKADIVITYDQKWRALWEIRFADPLADAETFQLDENNRITDIGRKTNNPAEIQGQYMGLLKFTPKGWSQVEEVFAELTPEKIDKLDMTSLLQLILKKNFPITAVQINGRWAEADSESDLRSYEQKLNTEGWSHDWRFDKAGLTRR